MKDLNKLDLKKVTKSIYFKIAIAVVIIVIVFVIINNLPKSDDYSREAGRDIDESHLSFSNLEYQNLAERLYDAMEGTGTDEDTVLSILKRINTTSDWHKLVQAFGVRDGNWWNDFDEGNLMEWLVDEHDSGEQEEIRVVLGRIGVTF